MFHAILLSSLVVAICAASHYATLKQVSAVNARGDKAARGRHLALTVGAITTAHVFEALIYTLDLLWVVRGLRIGDLSVPGPKARDLASIDYIYFRWSISRLLGEVTSTLTDICNSSLVSKPFTTS